MKLVGRRGRLRVRFAPVEVAVLTGLLDDLEAALDGAGDPQVLRRLAPAAYRDDATAEQEFRELTGSALRTERAERIGACRAELATGADGVDLDVLDPEIARRWLQVLNDLRLTLGTRLGITEDEPPGLDPADPELEQRTAYYWLTAVQDALVQALMRR